MPFELFKRIASEYEGEITETENEISITAKTERIGYQSNNGFTEWTISARKYMDNGEAKYFLSGHERGNWSGFTTSYSEGLARQALDSHQFKKKPFVQLSLFDI